MSSPAVDLREIGNILDKRITFVLPRVRAAFILSWMAFWLYLSLGGVLLSFSAIQYQANFNRANNGSEETTQQPVPLLKLRRQKYDDQAEAAKSLKKEIARLEPDKSASTSSLEAAQRAFNIEQIASKLVPLVFTIDDVIPPASSIIAEIRRRCEKAAAEAVKSQCGNAFDLADSDVDRPDQVVSKKNELHLQFTAIQAQMIAYEYSRGYSDYDELTHYEDIERIIFPWLPKNFSFVAVPHPTLVLFVTIFMGALGSALFMLQLQLSRQGTEEDLRTSTTWYLFRPLQGIAAALAIFLLVKAGQLSLGSSATNGDGSADFNVFVLALLGVISGLLSDSAMERLSAAGIELLRTAPGNRSNRDTAQNGTAGETQSGGSASQAGRATDAPESEADGVNHQKQAEPVEPSQADAQKQQRPAETASSARSPESPASPAKPDAPPKPTKPKSKPPSEPKP